MLFSFAMSRPSRNAPSGAVPMRPRTYFVSSKTWKGAALFQSDRMANLLIDVLRQYTKLKKFTVREFVIMRNHMHVLLTVPARVTIEKAVQMIKGNFSYRAGKELGIKYAIWQKGFSDVRITSRESYEEHVNYIYENPVRAGYAPSAEEYPYCSAYFRKLKNPKTAAAKAEFIVELKTARLKSYPDTI
jgi:REP-associated tyrosine transposase